MAFTPERGALIVDSQYENEEQQFLEEIHLSRSNADSGEQSSVKTYARLLPVKTEPMDFEEQTCSENGKSVQSFGEENASMSESSQMDCYSGGHRFIGHSPRNIRNYDSSSTANHYDDSNTDRISQSQEPGPIAEDYVEKQDTSRSGFDNLEAARAAWTPPTFRTYRTPCNVDWLHPRVRDVLRDYRNRKVSSRESAQLITKITGSPVSNTTVRLKSRVLDELDAQYVENGNVSRCSSEIGGSDGTDTGQSLRENGRIKRLQNNVNKPPIPGINAPIAAPPNSPYYLSFSRRFKQTSLTVPLNSDEVRLYRHASHSKSGRTIHFRCSRCDTLHQTYKSGEIARIKMVDGVVVSQLYPVHHERCKPIRLVEARAKEIERRCRKDIIMGMNPKEAWKKGRKAAISEATAAGFPVYGPGSILSAFPEWDKVRVLFGALRSRYIRRQMSLKQRMAGKKNFDPDERKLETADFDIAEITRLKKPNTGQSGIYSSAMRHDESASTSGLENVAISEGEEFVGNDFELDDFEEESLYNYMQDAGKVAGYGQASCASALNNNNSKSMVQKTTNAASLATSGVKAVEERRSEFSKDIRHGYETPDFDNTKIAHKVQAVERAIARATAQSVQSSPEQLTRAQILASARSSPASSMISTVTSAEGMSDQQRTEQSGSERKRGRLEAGRATPEDFITFVSPAGVLPCAAKKKRYSEKEARRKLREIEQWIAEYNARSDNKIATIHMSKSGDLKMHGSKYIIDSCLHSSVVRNLKSKCRNKEEVDEEGVDDDELVSIPLVRCLPNLEINAARNVDIRPMLNRFLDSMHFPWEPWFDKTRCPDYWPSAVPFYDPSNNLLSLNNLSQRRELKKHSIVDLERDILKYAFKHYTNFMVYHFGLPGPNYDEDTQNTDDNSEEKIAQQSTAILSADQIRDESLDKKVIGEPMCAVSETPEMGTSESKKSVALPGPSSITSESCAGSDFGEHFTSDEKTSNLTSSSSSLLAAALSDDKVMENQLALFRNSVLRIRYDTMGADVRMISDSIMKIQNHSTCRALVLFVDERNKLTVVGDKTLISAFLSSNLPQCLLPAMNSGFDNQTVILPLLQLYDDNIVDAMTEDRALDLLEDMMIHVNFPWSDPYEGSQPDCWPPEIPFCPPWSNDGRGILNRRIGANTPGQAAKLVLKSVRWFYSELMFEKLKLDDGLKKIVPTLAELTHNLLQERGSALQTPIPRAASVQEMSPFRVPGQVVRHSPSHHSYTSQLRTPSRHSGSSQELRMYSQSALTPATEVQTEFTPQNLSYRGHAAPLSPSQHSVSSQETVPFRLPPHHPLASAHLAVQQQQLAVPQPPYVIQTAESIPESYAISDDRNVSAIIPSESYVIQKDAPVEGPTTSVHSQTLATSQEFQAPQALPQELVMSEVRITTSLTSHHSSSKSVGSESSRSRKSSRHHSTRTESHESAGGASSQHFIVPNHPSQGAAYSKPGAVRLQSEQPHHMMPSTAALQHGLYVAEDPVTAGRLRRESSTFRTPSPRSTYSSGHPSSSGDGTAQGSSNTGEVIQQRYHQRELSHKYVPPLRNFPSQQHLIQQDPTSTEFLKVMCSCGPIAGIDARDCFRCDRCFKNYHHNCLPLSPEGIYRYCFYCLNDI